MVGLKNYCQVCRHESRAAIEQAVLNLKPLAQVARDFGFFYTNHADGRRIPNHKAIVRHRDKCMPLAFRAAQAEQAARTGDAIGARLAYLEAHVTDTLEAARKGRPLMVGDVPLLDDDGRPIIWTDWRLVLAAVNQGRKNAQLAAHLAGRTDADPADLDTIRTHLDSPEARALIARLERLAADDGEAATPATENSSGE